MCSICAYYIYAHTYKHTYKYIYITYIKYTEIHTYI